MTLSKKLHKFKDSIKKSIINFDVLKYFKYNLLTVLSLANFFIFYIF